MKTLNSKGYSLVELAIAVLILGAMAAAVLQARSYMARQTVNNSDKVFATEKAVQMFEEMRSLVSGGEQGITILDNYSDGSSYKSVLTTDQAVTLASDPLSGNLSQGAGWKFWRQIEVSHTANDPFSRIVTVRVYKRDDNDPTKAGLLLAETGGLLRTIVSVYPPTQVLDVYALTLSNVLGWFTEIPEMSGAFSQAVSDLQTRNPGLEIRTHYITQTGFGRDPLYMPYVNTANAADDTGFYMPNVYFYPDHVHDDNNVLESFFSATQLSEIGNILLNGNPVNDFGYAICDHYNNDVRYPDELADYAAVSQAAVNNGKAAPEITLRMLLEKMNSEPTSFRNAIIVSMHGEVLPMPAIRNYSDPAKDPGTPADMNMRVVTHPTNLHYESGNAVTLRVYSYYDGMEGGITPSSFAVTNLAPTITIRLPNLNLTSTNISVTAISGGVYPAGTTTAYAYTPLSLGATPPLGAPMSWSSTNGAAGTTITLYNTPLRCPEVFHSPPTPGVDTGGLPVSCELYGSEYISCPVSLDTTYKPDLTSTAPGPKNTARWVIVLKAASVSDGQHAVETRIGSDETTGALSNEPENLSRSYVWIGTGTGNPGDSTCGVTPWTERYQLNGDPRDEPYIDAKIGSVALYSPTAPASVIIDPASYNWYFKDLNNANGTGSGAVSDGYVGFDKTQAGYDYQNDPRDMPKYYYLYRRGLLQTQSIWCNLNGYSFWHADEGGEIGGTYTPYANSVHFTLTPWKPTDTVTKGDVNEIQTSSDYMGKASRDIAQASAGVTSFNINSQWYARLWRGELYPDDTYTNFWVPFGNLQTGDGNFFRVPYNNIVGTNSISGFDSGRTYMWAPGGNACAAFMDGVAVGAGAATYGFMHTTSAGTALGDLTTLGYNLYNIINFPLSSPVNETRPWTYSFDLHSSNLPADWTDPFYAGLRTTLSLPSIGGVSRIFYDPDTAIATSGPHGDTWHGVGAIQMNYTSGGNTNSAFVIASGLAPQGSFGAAQLAETDLSVMIRTFLDGGLYTGANHIPQLPLFQVSSGNPTNQFLAPAAVTVSWGSPVSTVNTSIWWRWAGFNNGANFYTEEYPGYNNQASNSYATDNGIGIKYAAMYSTDGGQNYTYMNTSSAAVTGSFDTATAAGVLNAPTSVIWNVSNATLFPQATYRVRVEGYRTGYPLHYSYHQLDININR